MADVKSRGGGPSVPARSGTPSIGNRPIMTCRRAMHPPTIGSTKLKSVFTHCQSWRRACARRIVVDDFNKFLLLFGASSIIVLFSVGIIQIADRARRVTNEGRTGKR